MDAGKLKVIVTVCSTGLVALAMLLDAFRPGGDYVSKALTFAAAIGGGTGLGWVWLKQPEKRKQEDPQ